MLHLLTLNKEDVTVFKTTSFASFSEHPLLRTHELVILLSTSYSISFIQLGQKHNLSRSDTFGVCCLLFNCLLIFMRSELVFSRRRHCFSYIHTYSLHPLQPDRTVAGSDFLGRWVHVSVTSFRRFAAGFQFQSTLFLPNCPLKIGTVFQLVIFQLTSRALPYQLILYHLPGSCWLITKILLDFTATTL